MPRPSAIKSINLPIDEQVRNLMAAISELYDMSEKHEHTLYGNDKPGMDEVVRGLVQAQMDAAKERSEIKAEIQKLNGEIVGKLRGLEDGIRDISNNRIERRETKLLNIKMAAETKQGIIQGVFTIGAIIVTALLTGSP